jgi:hypothetical protein
MHAFRTSRKSLNHAWTSAESHPNLLRLHETPLTYWLMLARIGQTKTTATGDIFVTTKEVPNPGATEVGANAKAKPRCREI